MSMTYFMNTRLTAKGQDTRDRILAAARDKLVSSGPEALVMRELADALEIKLGNLQYYFRTRDELLLAVMEREAVRDVEAIEQRMDQFQEPADAFNAIVADLVARWRGRSGVLFSLLGNLASHSPPFRQLYRQIYLRFYLVLESLLQKMAPALPAEEIAVRVRLITALIDGSSMQIQVGSVNAYLGRVQAEAIAIAMQNCWEILIVRGHSRRMLIL